MRFRLAVLLLATSVFHVGCASAGPNGSNPHTPPVPASLGAELLEMARLDQEMRQGLTPAAMQDTAFLRNLIRTDSLHSARLQRIVEQYGWPRAESVGAAGVEAAFLLLQHSPATEFQQRMLPAVEAAAERGEISTQEVALLTDRVLMRQGLPQRYGTQFDMREGRFVLYPVADEARLEELRAQMGLPPMEEYMKQMAEVYNTSVVRQP